MWRMLFVSIVAVGVSGCVPTVIGMGLGYLIADEVMEGDGKMDPLERLRGKENHDALAEREHYRTTYGYEYQKLVLERAEARKAKYEAVRNGK